MRSADEIVRTLREQAGLSQRGLAKRAATSQPAIARYERGVSTPSWETLERLAEACGRRIEVDVAMRPDPHDLELARTLLDLTPLQRLRALPRYARLHEIAQASK